MKFKFQFFLTFRDLTFFERIGISNNDVVTEDGWGEGK